MGIELARSSRAQTQRSLAHSQLLLRPFFCSPGGTIVKLGTAKHHAAYLDKMDTLELPGCFGMTELGHGSNVMGIETTAVYREDGFVLSTPNNEASKFWIGGAGHTAKICCVFAQLTMDGVW